MTILEAFDYECVSLIVASVKFGVIVSCVCLLLQRLLDFKYGATLLCCSNSMRACGLRAALENEFLPMPVMLEF